MSQPAHRASQIFWGSMLVNLGHTALSSRAVRALVRRVVGERWYRGLYRAGYNAFAVSSYGLGALWFQRLPDRSLYHLSAPWSWLARVGQLAGVLLVLDLIRIVGFRRLSGLGPFAALLRGRDVPPTPEGQGPPLGPDGELVARGSFAYTRHPDAWPFLLIFWGWPRMTVNRLALALSFTLYTIAGVFHEDLRLQDAYGPAFERYRRKVPFLLPRLSAPPDSIRHP